MIITMLGFLAGVCAVATPLKMSGNVSIVVAR
jgi:hypothetical protein